MLESQRLPLLGIKFILFLTCLSVYILFSPAHFMTTPDEELNLRTTLSLVQGHGGAVPSLGGFATKTGLDGKEYAQYGLGLPFAASFWCRIGLWIDPSANTSANQLSRFFETIHESKPVGTAFLRWWMSIFTMMVTALTVVFFFNILVHLKLSPPAVIGCSLVLAFGTYCWPHGRTFFTEPLSGCCLMAAVYAMLRYRQSHKSSWVLIAGIAWSYAVLTRLDSIVSFPAAAVFLSLVDQNGRFTVRIDWKRIMVFAIPFVAAVALILLNNQLRFGSFLSTGYEDQPEKIRFLTPVLVGLHGFLFTPGRSLFLYSPPLILSALGFVPLWKNHRLAAAGIFVIIASYLIVMSKWQNWAGGYDWGPRHIYQITPFLMIPAAYYIGQKNFFDTRIKRIGVALALCLSVFIQFLGLAADPILVTKQLLYAWPNTEISPGFNFHAVLMQFTVYLPQFSNPVLHWSWIVNHGADLVVFRFPLSPNFYLAYMSIPSILIGIAIFCFYRWIKYGVSGGNDSTHRVNTEMS